MELTYITSLAIIIVLGILVSLVSKKIGLPNIFFLIIIGILLGNIPYNGGPLVSFSSDFIMSIGVLAVAMIVFEGSSNLKLRDFNAFSFASLKLFFLVLIVGTLFVALAFMLLFPAESVFLGILIGMIFSATGAEVVLYILKNINSNPVKILEIESLLNTPFIIILVVMFVNVIQRLSESFNLVANLVILLQQIIVGIGSGVLVGLVIFKLMKRAYITEFHKNMAQLGIIGAALLTYVIAENIEGSGIVAVTTLGVFFGNSFMKEKTELQEFSSLFSGFLEILVFVMIGLVIKITFDHIFLAKSFALFVIHLIARFLICSIAFRKNTLKENIFMAIVSPKGIATATIVIVLSATAISGLNMLLNIVLFAMLCSILLASVACRFERYFLSGPAVQKQQKAAAKHPTPGN